MCKPSLNPLQHPCSYRSSGPVDKKVRLRTGQLCLGSHFSVTEGADHSPKAAQKPSQQPSHPPCSHAQETPPGLPWPFPNLGIAAVVCASRFQGRPSLSYSSRLVLSREPPSATWHIDSARCSVCVCVYKHTYTMCMCV